MKTKMSQPKKLTKRQQDDLVHEYILQRKHIIDTSMLITNCSLQGTKESLRKADLYRILLNTSMDKCIVILEKVGRDIIRSYRIKDH